MSCWSDEMLDAVNECLEDFPGQIIAPAGALGAKTYNVCYDYGQPSAGLSMIDGAFQASGHLSFTMRRTDYVAAGIGEKSLIARATAPTAFFKVDPIEDDESQPFVRLSATPMV